MTASPDFLLRIPCDDRVLTGRPAELPDRPIGPVLRSYGLVTRRVSRHEPGAMPVAFLKARLKAASES